MDAQEPQTLELATAALRRDPREAKVHAAACQAGDQDACLALGTDYELGNGVERSASRALELYRNACTQGIQLACVLEGALTRHRANVASDRLDHRDAFVRPAGTNRPVRLPSNSAAIRPTTSQRPASAASNNAFANAVSTTLDSS
jgi:hypothetical protein